MADLARRCGALPSAVDAGFTTRGRITGLISSRLDRALQSILHPDRSFFGGLSLVANRSCEQADSDLAAILQTRMRPSANGPQNR